MIKFILFIFLICFDNYLLADEVDDKQYVYKICKRPLHPSNPIINTLLTPVLKVLDFPCLEKVYLNPQHFHFFRVNKDDMNSEIYVNEQKINFKMADIERTKEIPEKIILAFDGNKSFLHDSCRKNDFENFGFFDNQVECNESSSTYSVCSVEVFRHDDLRSALKILLDDFENRKYELTSYNCQLFVNNLVDVYKKYQEIHLPMCVGVNYSNRSLISRLFSCITNSDNEFIDSLLFENKGFEWENRDEQICRLR